MVNKSIRTQEMANLLGVTPQTIRKYVNNNEIPYHRKPSGQLFFTPEDIKQALGEKDSIDQEEKWAYYIRSSSGNKEILQSQKDKLRKYYNNIAPVKIVSDKASGLNENRKGLKKLIDLSIKGEITDIAFTRPDRLARFGYKYLEELFNSYNVKLHHLDDNKTQSVEGELMQDS